MTARTALALASGALFGAGLALSGMINPAKVLNFLDVAGPWDPSLALVMAAALAVVAPAWRIAAERRRPLFATRFETPARTDLDPRLLGGAAVFGLGWGLSGLCPGPALAVLVTGLPQALAFAAAMAAGMLAYRLLPPPR